MDRNLRWDPPAPVHHVQNRNLTLILASLVFSCPVAAHHGFGLFDMNRDISLEGTLTGFDFVNPHSYVYFNVTGAGGNVTKMRCEMRAATVLRRSGWSPAMFVAGKHVTIKGHPHRTDPSSCYVETLAIGDAPVLKRYQQLDKGNTASRADRPLRLPDGRPNISGEWAQEQYLLAHPAGGGLGKLVPKSLVDDVESGKLAAADAPDAGWFPRPVTLTEAGRKASEALKNLPPDQNPRLSCKITSILFDWVFDGPINRISQGKDVITFEYGRGLTRTVHMDMDHHPTDIALSRGGHSIGHWDGDTLVVDTVGFEPGSVAGNVTNSSEFHVIERFTLARGGRVLKREYTADDPVYFANQYSGADELLPADAPFAVDKCKELAREYMKPVAGSTHQDK